MNLDMSASRRYGHGRLMSALALATAAGIALNLEAASIRRPTKFVKRRHESVKPNPPRQVSKHDNNAGGWHRRKWNKQRGKR